MVSLHTTCAAIQLTLGMALIRIMRAACNAPAFASTMYDIAKYKRSSETRNISFHSLAPIFSSTNTYTCIQSSQMVSKHKTILDYSFLLKDKPELPTEELLSKDEIDYITSLVQQRSDARLQGDYASADSLRDQIDALSNQGYGEEIEGCVQISLPDGYKIEVKDIPRNDGGGSEWHLRPTSNSEDNKSKENKKTGNTVLGLAHVALGLASSSSERGIPIDYVKLNRIILRAKQRLIQTGEQELRGRAAADAIFWFAIAGVFDDQNDVTYQTTGGVTNESTPLDFSLFDALTFICLKELSRFGDRNSCRPSDIMHIIERIAAAGVKSDIFVQLQREAARCLEQKDANDVQNLAQRGVIELLHRGKFELHSERSLLWIWRFSTKQRKQRAFLQSAAKHWESAHNRDKFDVSSLDEGKSLTSSRDESMYNMDWDLVFKDPTRPLVIDIGCGMGVSILGLSTLGIDESMSDSRINLDWNRCNFLGADLSRIGINFASAISKRWGLQDNVHFTFASAEEIMEHVAKTYPGKVNLCMIQFPTPFRFNDELSELKESEVELMSVKSLGNMQLPTDAFSGFMVTKRLLEHAGSALSDDEGRLLLQSNCEDVAVFMNRLANDSGFESIPVKDYVDKIHDTEGNLPQRTMKWIALGGERAEGPIWNSNTCLPSVRGATETEIACGVNGTPVHRVLLKTMAKT